MAFTTTTTASTRRPAPETQDARDCQEKILIGTTAAPDFAAENFAPAQRASTMRSYDAPEDGKSARTSKKASKAAAEVRIRCREAPTDMLHREIDKISASRTNRRSRAMFRRGPGSRPCSVIEGTWPGPPQGGRNHRSRIPAGRTRTSLFIVVGVFPADRYLNRTQKGGSASPPRCAGLDTAAGADLSRRGAEDLGRSYHPESSEPAGGLRRSRELDEGRSSDSQDHKNALNKRKAPVEWTRRTRIQGRRPRGHRAQSMGTTDGARGLRTTSRPFSGDDVPLAVARRGKVGVDEAVLQVMQRYRLKPRCAHDKPVRRDRRVSGSGH